MKLKYDVRLKVNSSKIAKDIRTNKDFGLFASTEWHRLISPYTPKQTGNLIEKVELKPFSIKYVSVYARRLYYGVKFAFRKDKNPLASAKWDEVAKGKQLGKLKTALNKWLANKGVNNL